MSELSVWEAAARAVDESPALGCGCCADATEDTDFDVEPGWRQVALADAVLAAVADHDGLADVLRGHEFAAEAQATIRRMDHANVTALREVGAWDESEPGVVSSIHALAAERDALAAQHAALREGIERLIRAAEAPSSVPGVTPLADLRALLAGDGETTTSQATRHVPPATSHTPGEGSA